MGVLDALLRLWRVTPDSAAADDRYVRNTSVKAAEIRGLLLKTFAETQIVDEISSFLSGLVPLMETDDVPDRRDVFLCSCCLALISDPHGIRIPVALVQDIVRTFPISIWYRAMTRVVTAYLRRTDLLEALIRGLSGDAPPAIVENCVQGVRMYAKFARVEDDPELLDKLRRQISPLIDRYIGDANVDIAEYAERAKTGLRAYIA